MKQIMQRPHIMGIMNVTPDSFSGDGILCHDDYINHALVQAQQMIADGADILDIGGESSRPGSTPISVDEEKRRVIPVITAIKNAFSSARIAVDTVKAAVADEALQAGADMINDISSLGDPAMGDVVARYQATVVLMHNRSRGEAISSTTTAGYHYHAPFYDDVVDDVMHDMQRSVDTAIKAGIPRSHIILDPGIGFGKTPLQNMTLISHLEKIKTLDLPVLMGVSRKSFIGHVLDARVDQRLEGTAACVTACILHGADIVRVHDVKFMVPLVKMAMALRDA